MGNKRKQNQNENPRTPVRPTQIIVWILASILAVMVLVIGSVGILAYSKLNNMQMTQDDIQDLLQEVTHDENDFSDNAEELEGLDKIGLKHTVPQGSYFVMVDISDFQKEGMLFHGKSDMEFCEWMIRNVGVAAVPGSSFFREPVNHLIRLHFARSEETLYEALDRLAKIPQLLG